jgi:hypothetical protein
MEMAEKSVKDEWMWNEYPEDQDIEEDYMFWDEVELVAEELREEYEGGK